jgi:hypothetical protein
MGTTSENPVRNHYMHAPERVKEHKADLDDQAKNPQKSRERTGEKGRPMQAVVFQSKEAKLLVEALEKPDHKYRQQARQAVRRFTAAIEKDLAQDLIKDRGIVMDQASRKYGVPASTLRGWEGMGLLTALYRGRGKQGVYYNEEDIARLAPIYHQAKQEGEQPAKRIKAVLAQETEDTSQPSS